MTMEWSNRDYRFDSDGGNGRGSFQGHNKHMRDYRGSRSRIEGRPVQVIAKLRSNSSSNNNVYI